MKPEEAINVLKQLIDVAVNKGVFANSESVIAAHNSLATLSEAVNPEPKEEEKK